MKREFPDHPLVGVGGVVIHRNRVLLIRRGGEPLKGEWSIPGGLVELGEQLPEGARRELREETGLEVEPLEVVAVFDRIMYDTHPTPKQKSHSRGKEGGRRRRVRYHYVIVDYVCRVRRGRLTPGSDVVDARWVRPADLPKYHLTEMATWVVHRAFEFFKERKRKAPDPTLTAGPGARDTDGDWLARRSASTGADQRFQPRPSSLQEGSTTKRQRAPKPQHPR